MSDPIRAPAEDSVQGGRPMTTPSAPVLSRNDALKLIAKRKEEREARELSQVLNTAEGQAVIMRILHRCHIYEQAIMDDAHQGRRSLGCRLISEIQGLSDDSWPNLLSHHAKRMRALKAEEAALMPPTNARSASDA